MPTDSDTCAPPSLADPSGRLVEHLRSDLAPLDPLDPLERLAGLFDHQRQHWSKGDRVGVEAYLQACNWLAADPETLLDLIYNEVLLRRTRGEQPKLSEYLERFPRLGPDLVRQFAVDDVLDTRSAPDMGDLSHPTLLAGRAGATPLPPAVPAVPGYLLLGELGRGGMGVVYKALQVELNRLVALKMVLHAGHIDEEIRNRFRTEARAVARLQHPGIVQVYEVGEARGVPFFSMEFCSGGSLSRRLSASPLDPRESAELIRTLALAVHAAHEQKVIHRDLKPSNVLLTADGTPKVADFGLAKRIDEVGRTRTGAILGTPAYMAPEQARGRHREISPATDVYALGAILYECLTGRPPFRASSDVDTALLVITQPPVPPSRYRPGLPTALEAICLRCLHKEPTCRPAGARRLADDLDRWLAGADGSASIASRQRPHLAMALLLALPALLLACLAPFSLPAWTPAPHLTAALAAPAPHGKLWGLVVGIGAEINPSPRENALAVYRLLLGQKGAVYRDTDVTLLLDEEASAESLLRQVAQIASRARPNDAVLVYLSGGGATTPIPGRTFIFGPADGTLLRHPESALGGASLLSSLARSPCRTGLIVDANHAGALLDDLRGLALPAGKDPLILAACQRGENAYATNERAPAIFTDALLATLSGQAPWADRDGDQLLEPSEVFSAVQTRVQGTMRQLRRKTGEAYEQNPALHLPSGLQWALGSLRPIVRPPEPFLLEDDRPGGSR